ncbi:MAG TPA: M23 family metallopeptidase, partial [Candidatus Saccharimonadales bacterium]|nr:M23 family metallopeptidase [Candidatus Saccharimonadales bacterium]
ILDVATATGADVVDATISGYDNYSNMNEEANEQWIIKYLCSQPGEDGDQPGLYDGDCSVPAGGNSSSELTDQNDAHHDPYHDYVRECFINPNAQEVANDPNCQSGTHGTSSEPDLYDRFRVYRFDLGVANMMTSYNNTNDDQNPADTSGSTTPAPLPTSSTGYVNPLKDIQNLTPMRLDQGVDYSGTGPIYAMGPGTVDNVHAPPGSGWGPNNIYISYTLSSGPANGKTVYVAECVDPAVNPGDTLTAGQKIGTMTNCGSGIEIGWSQSSGDLPVAPDLVDCSGAPSTGLGSVQADALAVNFSSLLQSLGAPGGTYQCGQGAVHGSLPSGYPSSWQ